MKSYKKLFNVPALIAAGLLFGTNSFAEEAAGSSDALREGSYVAPMAVFVSPNDDSDLDDGNGGAFALGFRKDRYALEIVPTLVDLDGIDLASVAVNGLVFPIEDSGFYLTAGISASNYKDYPVVDDQEDFSTFNFDAGLGFLMPLSLGEKDFALRAEARYRVSHREEEYNDTDTDLDVPGDFKQTVVSIGLQIPLGN